MNNAQQPGPGSSDPFRGGNGGDGGDIPIRSIIVENRTGKFQRYVVYLESPQASHQGLEIVCKVAVANDGQKAQLDFPLNFMAWHGHSDGPPAAGASVVTTEAINVRSRDKPTLKLQYGVQNGVPRFRDISDRFSDPDETFAVDSDGSFTTQDAINGHWLFGIGIDSLGHGPSVPVFAWPPEPNQRSQLYGHGWFNVSTGDYDVRTYIDVGKLGTIYPINFDKITVNVVNVIHNEDGSYTGVSN